MNSRDKNQIPEVQFTFKSELQPGELEFLIKKRDVLIQMKKEKGGTVPHDIDDRLKSMGLFKFEEK